MQATLTTRYKLLVMLLDLLVFMGVTVLIALIRSEISLIELMSAIGFWFMAFVLLSSLYIFGTYDIDQNKKYFPLALRQIISFLVTFLFVLVINYLLAKERAGIFGRGILIGSIFIFGLISFCYRWIFFKWFSYYFEKLKYLFVVDESKRKIIEDQWISNYGFSSEFIVVNDSSDEQEIISRINQKWSAVIVAMSASLWSSEFSDQLMKSRFGGQEIVTFAEFFESVQKKVPVDFLNQEWFIFEKGFSLINNPMGLRIKRLVDLFLAIGLLLLTWPIILIAGILIKLESAGDVFYKQVRTGLNDHDFTIYKLRSMTKNAESNGAQWASANDARVTFVGKWIRLTRIDELPQLWNVIKGDMSFIGPRPERPEFNVQLEEKIPFYRLRHLVRPGITGWAQVMYPYGASIEDSKQKLQFDLYYIKNFSFLLDLQIVFKTIQVVLFGKGR